MIRSIPSAHDHAHDPTAHRRLFLACGVAALLYMSASLLVAEEPSEAAEDGFPAEEMLVTGTRTPWRAATIPHAVTVLEGDRLDDSISTSVADALRFVPGLQVSRQGGPGGRTEIFMRGLDSNHVVVLVDGVRLNDPTNSRGGSFDPTTLALLDIERIEVVRGPLSTVYGSDALAGAINIITRRAYADTKPEASFRMRGGRFHNANIIAQARTGLGGVAGLSLGAAYDTFRDPESHGGYDGVSLKAKINAELPFEIDFEAFGRVHNSSSSGFPDSSGGSELATIRSMEDRNVREILFGGSVQRYFENLVTLEGRASWTSRREKLRSPGIDIVPPLDPGGQFDIPPSRSGDEYKRIDVGLSAAWEFPEIMVHRQALNTLLVTGADFVDEDGEGGTFLDFTGTGAAFTPNAFFDHRRTFGAYAELQESVGDYVTVSGSLRYDTIDDAKDRLSPSVGASVQIPGAPLTLFGNYGQGFKLPSFYAVGNPLVGNPMLRKETSRGWEIGLRTKSLDGKVRAQLSYFDLRVRDLITFDNQAFSLANQQRLISHGVELEIDWQPDDCFEIHGGGTWNHTRFKDSPVNPENRPRWRGFLELRAKPIPTLELTVRAIASSSLKATSFRTQPRVDTLNGYGRLDLRAAWEANDRLELFFEIQNVTDTTPREAVGFESPGIAPRAGITLRL